MCKKNQGYYRLKDDPLALHLLKSADLKHQKMNDAYDNMKVTKLVCSVCRQDLIGDGNHTVLHCPDAPEDLIDAGAPEDDPIECEEL